METLLEPITQRRKQTRNIIFRYLYEADAPRAKQEISTALSFSLPTVHQNITELIQAGLVQQAGAQQSTGGRRAIGLSVAENARFAIGVSITEDKLRFVAANLRLQEMAYKKVSRADLNQKENVSDLLVQELERFIDENELDRTVLLGVGITVPAVIDVDKKMIILAPTLRLRDSSIEQLTSRIPYPSFVENDGTCGGFAEWFARPGLGNMAYFSLENGVGGAVLVDGVPYAGDNRRSGEFGHMCVHLGGLACKCGKQGCLEAYCSATRLSTDLGITLEEFFEGVAGHTPAYEALLDDALRHLAIAISNVRMMLDCNVVVGGFLSEYLEPYMPRLRQYVGEQNPFGASADYLDLCFYPKRALVLGVALHFIQEFLDNI